ncbi:hypothetical protein [Segniliparus rugosus]|uniref:Uncharacterized protein n=1 Tax=Segniliparus rugosus (strain ATCC BAA-974 / DSM 45345 / CCUG 50838 / CIP 108380 / JCM 13579 / CDC 945) TaxID=679197 RepID=E5XPQ1_SEGRC|nr:hypothetical protein [Segniliparus rugosus]EFV13649.1 hypothetical protein HMPREF9336_01473 [Segniliparus rugosus ATCC BAA-974]
MEEDSKLDISPLDALCAAAAERRFGIGLVEGYPDLAVRLLLADYDTPALRELAGFTRREVQNYPASVHDLFVEVLAELDVAPFGSDEEAILYLARHWSKQLLRGELSEREASRLLYWVAPGELPDDWEARHPALAGLMPGFSSLYFMEEHEVSRSDWEKYKADARGAARALLDSDIGRR